MASVASARLAFYFQGETLVQLVGHYFGLLHVGRCIELDTCKAMPGLDPMTNYMNVEPTSAPANSRPVRSSAWSAWCASTAPT